MADNKLLRELVVLYGGSKVKDEHYREKAEKLGFNPDDLNYNMAITISQYEKALKGDTKAFLAIHSLQNEDLKNNLSNWW